MAIIDPGPDVEAHLEAVADAVGGAEAASILVTHGHPDHAPGAAGLARRLDAGGVPVQVLGPAGVGGVERALADGETVPTDEGDLSAVETPGHARAHLSFHWPSRGALFAGDLLLGKGDTVWVGEYEGAVADYLRSLERVRALGLRVIYPAHGPALTDPEEALDRFVAHRLERIRQVEAALDRHPEAGIDELMDLVYGKTLPAAAERAARMSMAALKAHVEAARDRA